MVESRTLSCQRTEVEIAPPRSVQAQGGIARRTMLGFEFADVLVEAGLVGYMGARELQNPFAAKRVG